MSSYGLNMLGTHQRVKDILENQKGPEVRWHRHYPRPYVHHHQFHRGLRVWFDQNPHHSLVLIKVHEPVITSASTRSQKSPRQVRPPLVGPSGGQYLIVGSICALSLLHLDKIYSQQLWTRNVWLFTQMECVRYEEDKTWSMSRCSHLQH